MAIKASEPGSDLGKFVLLDDNRYDIPDEKITILGGTLFTHPPHDELHVIDEYYDWMLPIRDWGTTQHIQAYTTTLDYFARTCKAIEEEDPGRAVVILTHHCPSIDPLDIGIDDTSDHRTSIYWDSSEIAYHPPLAWGANVKLWAFGSTHFNIDHEDARTGRRLYCNQRGPCNDCAGFNVSSFVDVMPLEDLPTVEAEYSEHDCDSNKTWSDEGGRVWI